MTALPTTGFERALAASGLVPYEAVQELQSSVVLSGQTTLADALVEQGLLNSWQVHQLNLGRTKFSLGPYQIIDAIGRGGMGYVFKARHALLGRVEAIKVLPRERTRSEAIESFLREIRAQSQLDHPNVVRVSYADRDGETYYLVTEYVPGIDLRRLVRRAGQLPIDVAALVALEVCQALEYAHRRGIVHRDIKPGNVLVTPDGDVKLTDLGLAWRLEDPPQVHDDKDRRIVGTCDYLAPEAVQRPSSVMPVSDVYSLGCTLYYALTGKVPYPGGNPREKLRRVVREDPIDPLSLRSGLPKKMVALLSDLMHRDHHSRTPTAAIAAQRLRSFVRPKSREAAAELVQRFHLRPEAGGAGGAHADETIDEPLTGDPFASGNPAAISDAMQPTAPIAAVDQETEPLDRTPPSQPVESKGRSRLDLWVWGIAGVALIGAAGIALSAILR